MRKPGNPASVHPTSPIPPTIPGYDSWVSPEEAIRELPWMIRRAELLDSPRAALVHALLAKACRALGREDQALRLSRRAELYHDSGELRKEYEILRD